MFFNNKNLNKIGSPPGSLVYTGKEYLANISINHIKFNSNYFENISLETIKENLIDFSYINWIKILGLSDVQKIKEINNIINIDKLTLEDILNVGQRPKIEIHNDYIFLVFKILSFDEKAFKLKEAQTFVSSNTSKYIKDVIDHIVSIMDFVTIYREMINSMFESHQTNVSNKMNQIMTTLTIFSAVFIPLTFLAGIYGMNFEHIPELSFKYSYPVFLCICVLVAFSMIRFFRYKKWI